MSSSLRFNSAAICRSIWLSAAFEAAYAAKLARGQHAMHLAVLLCPRGLPIFHLAEVLRRSGIARHENYGANRYPGL